MNEGRGIGFGADVTTWQSQPTFAHKRRARSVGVCRLPCTPCEDVRGGRVSQPPQAGLQSEEIALQEVQTRLRCTLFWGSREGRTHRVVMGKRRPAEAPYRVRFCPTRSGSYVC